MAIYDGSDKGGEHIAGGSDFEEAADDHDTAINVNSWNDTITKLTDYVRDHGRIDYLAVFDHGNSPSYTQQVGSERLTPEQAAQLQSLMAPGATILLAGCHVGANADYCNSIATATGSTVTANTDLVQYSDRWWWFWDYRGEGDWIDFTGNNPKPKDAVTMNSQ